MDLTAKDGGVLKEVTKEGAGELPAAGMKCELEYTGKLDSGKVFDTTKDSVTGSFEFKLGKGEVISGWDLAVATMKKGEKATVTIKPEYGQNRWEKFRRTRRSPSRWSSSTSARAAAAGAA